MHSNLWICMSIFSTVVLLCKGHHYFRDYIPNGHNVKYPCDPDKVWERVGHVDNLAQALNAFGRDFRKAMKNGTKLEDVWAKICENDSDSDGRKNGVELGDPSCTWKYKQTSPSAVDLSHPGFNEETICE